MLFGNPRVQWDRAACMRLLLSQELMLSRSHTYVVSGAGSICRHGVVCLFWMHLTNRLRSRAHDQYCRDSPCFDEAMHTESEHGVLPYALHVFNCPTVISSLWSLNVCRIFGDRLDLSSLTDKQTRNGKRVVRTQSGRDIAAKLVVSTSSLS